VKELIAGGAAGAVAKSAVAPLERVKILFQTGRLAAGGGTGATLAAIARTEGVRGLFKGNGASVLRIVPYAAINFGAYEQYRAAIVSGAGLDPGRRVPAVVDLVAGAGAGATAVLATYPLDLARTRLAVASEAGIGAGRGVAPAAGAAARPSVRSVLAATLAADGAAGLYRGVGPTLAGILPYAGLKFYVYQAAKHMLADPTSAASAAAVVDGGDDGTTTTPLPPPPPPKPPLLLTLAFGAGAGLIAQTATYPLDVVRRQMQIQGGGGVGGGAGGGGGGASCSSPPFTSTLDGLMRVWAAGGARALFAGVTINYLKVVPSTAIGFTLYDALKAWMGLPHNL
jgi:solute carrier family 25 protein 16